MKHLKKFNESWFKNPFKNKNSGYKSQHVEIYGDLNDDELNMLKAIDICRDNGFNLKDASGEITDGDAIWVYKGDKYLAIKPDYRIGQVEIYDLSGDETISTFDIEEPEIMADKICNLLKI